LPVVNLSERRKVPNGGLPHRRERRVDVALGARVENVKALTQGLCRCRPIPYLAFRERLKLAAFATRPETGTFTRLRSLYGVTHTHFAVVSGIALASNCESAASRKYRPGIASIWTLIIQQ
jgi:hypothetical protein